jgi:hypothetical protein
MARARKHRIGVAQHQPGGAQGVDALERQPVHRKLAFIAQLLTQARANLGGKTARRSFEVPKRTDMAQSQRRADVVNGRQPPCQVFAAEKVIQDPGAVGEHQQIPRRRACGPDRHVARTGRVQDVDRVDDHRGRHRHLPHHGLQPATPRPLQRVVLRVGTVGHESEIRRHGLSEISNMVTRKIQHPAAAEKKCVIVPGQ